MSQTAVKNFFSKFGKYLLILFPIKALPLIGKTYFQGFYIVFGFFSLWENPRVKKILFPLFLMGLYGLFLGTFFLLADGNYFPLLRAIQFIFLLYTLQGLMEWVTPKDWLRLLLVIAAIAVILYIVEILYTKPVLGRVYFSLKRYTLIVGEPNYSAFFFTCLAGICIVLKKYWLIPVWLILSVLTLSRTPFLFYIPLIFFLLLYKIFGDRIQKFILAIVLLVVFQPIIQYFVYEFVSPKFLSELVEITTRFYIQPLYFKMFLEHPLGLGLGEPYNYFGDYLAQSASYLHSVVGIEGLDINEQHSLYSQILTELGIIGYGLFVYFVVSAFRKIWINSRVNALVFASLMPLMMTLNVINEVGFYFLISVLVINEKEVVRFNQNLFH